MSINEFISNKKKISSEMSVAIVASRTIDTFSVMSVCLLCVWYFMCGIIKCNI